MGKSSKTRELCTLIFVTIVFMIVGAIYSEKLFSKLCSDKVENSIYLEEILGNYYLAFDSEYINLNLDKVSNTKYEYANFKNNSSNEKLILIHIYENDKYCILSYGKSNTDVIELNDEQIKKIEHNNYEWNQRKFKQRQEKR